MRRIYGRLGIAGLSLLLVSGAAGADAAVPLDPAPAAAADSPTSEQDQQLAEVLAAAGFTGTIQAQLEPRLGRPVNSAMVELGRLLFFDNIEGMHKDNSCAGCHGPNFGLGGSGSMAIGVDSNGIVGRHRAGPFNQRRAPAVANTAFYPKLMLNGRFFAPTDNPFDNSLGFTFPAPEGTTRFPPSDSRFPTLLSAQGLIPQTELVEMAGFTGTVGTIGPDFDAFDDGHGDPLPAPDGTGTRNEPIRAAVLARLNANPEYLERFGDVYNGGIPFSPGGIELHMIGQSLAEFQTANTFADAPLDRFARGDHRAMNARQVRGALLFFGDAGCVRCHSVAGRSNEMFSDFENHVIGVPQIAPVFGVGRGDVKFDGPGANEDFGAEQITGNSADRYKFRTAPLRNLAASAAFMHNGAFTRLEDAIRHHLNVFDSARSYNPSRAGVVDELAVNMGPIEPVLARVDPLLAVPLEMGDHEVQDLVAFVGDGLTDPRVNMKDLCKLVPDRVPSRLPVLNFSGCK